MLLDLQLYSIPIRCNLKLLLIINSFLTISHKLQQKPKVVKDLSFLILHWANCKAQDKNIMLKLCNQLLKI